MYKKSSKTLLALFLAAFMIMTAMPIQAKVSKEEADRLKKDLTPLGAERAGNAEGTIPPWTGGLSEIPKGISYDPTKDRFHPDPYPDDKILFTITAKNYQDYADNLSEGQIAMFKKFPDTWKLNIYPSRRSVAYPKELYENTYLNALETELVTEDGSDGLVNGFCGTPFPIPKSGAEGIWNHVWRYWGRSYTTMGIGAQVYPDGTVSIGQTSIANYYLKYYDYKNFTRDEFLSGIGTGGGFFLLQLYDAPARRKGEILGGWDPIDYRGGTRSAWQYMPGQRRVRRAPNVSYDTPEPGSGGQNTYDDAFMFGGRPDRFNWKYLGKKEMFILYNTYRTNLDFTSEQILTPNHINPECLRWELHRVWVLEATKKEDQRHCYGRRVFYQDEDSWIIAQKDQYDTRGELWRFGFWGSKMLYDRQEVASGEPQFDHDLTTTMYYAYGALTNLERPTRWDTEFPGKGEDYFGPQNIRQMGKR